MLGPLRRRAARLLLALSVVANLGMAALPAAPAYAQPAAQAAPTSTLFFAATPPSATYPPQVAPGTSFTIDVDINSSANIGGVQFAIDYDPTVLTPTNVAIGTFFSTYATNNACSTFSVSFL